jgi:hypothetical protein
MLIVLPLAYEYLAARQFDLRRVRPDILTLGLVPLGGVAFAAYVFTISGEPLAVLEAGSAWGRQLTPPWEVVLPYLVQPSGTHGYFEVSILDFGFTLLMLALTIFTWRRVRPSYALFMGLFLLVVVSSGTLTSSMRYALELFPLLIGLAIWGRRRLFDRAYLGVAAYMALVFMHKFAAHQWLA